MFEGVDIEDLDVTESGLFFRLRIYAWKHLGLPGDFDRLKKIAIMTCGISSYRFKKCWQNVQQKFSKTSDGRLVYEPDENRRIQTPAATSKFKELGKKGAEARWKKPSQNTLQPVPLSDSVRHPAAIGSAWQTADNTYRTTNTAAAEESRDIGPSLPVLAAAVENKTECPNTFRLIASIFADVTPAFVTRLLGEAQKVLPTVSDEDLSLAVRATYQPKKQISAGLFLETIPAYLANHKPQPKPVQFENYVYPEKQSEYEAFLARSRAMSGV